MIARLAEVVRIEGTLDSVGGAVRRMEPQESNLVLSKSLVLIVALWQLRLCKFGPDIFLVRRAASHCVRGARFWYRHAYGRETVNDANASRLREVRMLSCLSSRGKISSPIWAPPFSTIKNIEDHHSIYILNSLSLARHYLDMYVDDCS